MCRGLRVAALLLAWAGAAGAFQSPLPAPARNRHLLSLLRPDAGRCPRAAAALAAEDSERDKEQVCFNPLGELRELLNNLDAVVDDFLNKRMGNGEVSTAGCVTAPILGKCAKRCARHPAASLASSGRQRRPCRAPGTARSLPPPHPGASEIQRSKLHFLSRELASLKLPVA